MSYSVLFYKKKKFVALRDLQKSLKTDHKFQETRVQVGKAQMFIIFCEKQNKMPCNFKAVILWSLMDNF